MRKSYKDLDAWQFAFKLVTQIYKYTSDFPRTEDYRLTSQMCRPAVSITGNIAEGSGRGSDKDYVRFLYMARGSTSELENYILLAWELGYLSSDHLQELEVLIKNVGKTLNGLIKYLESEPYPHRTLQVTSGKRHNTRTRDM
ncbi:MAG: four helix bundle protein [bacterium]|nr:four helix bundle protein [bacterium]